MTATQIELDIFLGGNNSWRRKGYEIIVSIPSGCLATYGRIAEILQQQGFTVSPRNIAWLRQRLYYLLGHNTSLPLHRIAKSGDIHSLHDSEDTRSYNERKKSEEGFYSNPKWL